MLKGFWEDVVTVCHSRKIWTVAKSKESVQLFLVVQTHIRNHDHTRRMPGTENFSREWGNYVIMKRASWFNWRMHQHTPTLNFLFEQTNSQLYVWPTACQQVFNKIYFAQDIRLISVTLGVGQKILCSFHVAPVKLPIKLSVTNLLIPSWCCWNGTLVDVNLPDGEPTDVVLVDLSEGSSRRVFQKLKQDNKTIW